MNFIQRNSLLTDRKEKLVKKVPLKDKMIIRLINDVAIHRLLPCTIRLKNFTVLGQTGNSVMSYGLSFELPAIGKLAGLRNLCWLVKINSGLTAYVSGCDPPERSSHGVYYSTGKLALSILLSC